MNEIMGKLNDWWDSVDDQFPDEHPLSAFFAVLRSGELVLVDGERVNLLIASATIDYCRYCPLNKHTCNAGKSNCKKVVADWLQRREEEPCTSS